MRWKLKSLLIAVTLLCIVCARVAYLEHRFQRLREAGAEIFYDWQEPFLTTKSGLLMPHEINDFRIHWWEPNRTWMQRLYGSTIGNDPVAVELDLENVNSGTISELKQMPRLESVLLVKTVVLTRSRYGGFSIAPDADEDFERMKMRAEAELPGVTVQLKHQTDFSKVKEYYLNKYQSDGP